MDKCKFEVESSSRSVKTLESKLADSSMRYNAQVNALENAKHKSMELESRNEAHGSTITKLNSSLNEANMALQKSSLEKESLEELNRHLEASKSDITQALSDKSILVSALETQLNNAKQDLKERDDRVLEYESEALLRSLENEKIRRGEKETRDVLDEKISNLESILQAERNATEKVNADNREVGEHLLNK